MRTVKYPYIEQRGYNKWYCRLRVPDDVRAVIGRPEFVASTGQDDPAKASEVAAQMIAAWKQQIADARQPDRTPPRWLVEQVAYQLCQIMGVPSGDGEEGWAEAIIEEAKGRWPNGGPIWSVRNITPSEHDRPMMIDELLQTSPAPPSSALTPFLTYLDDWYAATNLSGETRDIVKGHIREFADMVDEPLETLSSEHVQKWAKTLLKMDQRARTVRAKRHNVSRYWRHLQTNGKVPHERDPFDRTRLEIKDERNNLELAKIEQVRWEPEDVPRIIRAAWERDPALGALTEIGCFAGARLASIAGLNIRHIRTFKGVPIFTFADKTKAGIRVVPIVPRLRPLIADLSRNATKDGFLFHANPNKYNKRNGNVLGHMFGVMTGKMEWDDDEIRSQEYRKQRTFHSLRHTVIHLLRQSGCSETICNQICGHEGKKSTSAGYGQDVGPVVKLELMLAALNYEGFPAVV